MTDPIQALLSVAAWLLAGPVLVLLGWFILEVLLGLRALPDARQSDDLPRTTVLIPAHNEALGIADTVTRLRIEPHPALSILVVADNCSDDTAALARSAGAAVIERNDPERRGKGFALDFGRNHLGCLDREDQPQVVLVLDADCRTDLASVRRLAHACWRQQQPIQARYLLIASAQASGDDHEPLPLTQLSNFAMLVKNLVRARGLQRAGGGIPLFGSGMAFPWLIFAGAQLATDHLVEDMQLALDLARAGVRVLLVENARVESAPAPDSAMATQRGRWERGFLRSTVSQGLPMLIGGLTSGSRHRFGLGMHLLVPPLALLLMVSALVLAATAALALIGASSVPAIVLAAVLTGALGAVAAAWVREGRGTLSPRAAARAPLYLLWKIPLYLGFLKKDRGGWTRTRRVGERD